MRKLLLSIGFMVATGAIAQVINTFPYNQNFEGEGASTACNGYTMLSTGWFNDNTDNNDWVPDAGGTTSGATGPSIDYNPGNSGGKYMYTETSGCSNDVRNLETPWFDFTATTSMEMSFAYHMYGATMGTMAVDYRTGLGSPWTSLVGAFTDNVDLWQISTSDISFLGGNDSVKFRIVANTGTSFTSDMAIDDFTIVETVFDATVTDNQGVTCFGDANGTLTVTPIYGQAPYSYSWDNGGTTATISGLSGGTYCCTVTDNLGANVVVCADVAEASAPLAAYVHTPASWVCTDSMGMLVIDSITGGINITPSTDCGISPFTCSATTMVAVDTSSMTTNTTTGYPCPMGNWYWGNREQFLYRATELNAIGVQPGNITGIAFYVQSLGTSTTTLTNWTIKMGCTPANNTNGWNDTACVEVVAPYDHTIQVGWNWFPFDQEFYWNGTDNLLIETCFNNSSFTQNVIMRHTTPDAVNSSSIYYRADASTVCGSSTITGTSTMRPATIFDNCFIDNNPSYNYTYFWDTGSANDTTYVADGTYTLTVTDSVGCQISEMLTINWSEPVNVDDATICDQNVYPLAATPGFDSYSWNTGGTASIEYIMTGGTYYVNAVDSLGCMTSDTAWITTIPSPVLAASASPETFGMDGAIYLSIYGNAYPFTVDWDNDGTGDNDDTENIFNLTAGDYTVVVTDTNGCYTELTVTVTSQVGLGEETISLFQIYPNPTNGLFYIQPIAEIGNQATGNVTDASGRIVRNISFNGNQIVTVDMHGLERGIYFVNIMMDGNQTTTKIILQ